MPPKCPFSYHHDLGQTAGGKGQRMFPERPRLRPNKRLGACARVAIAVVPGVKEHRWGPRDCHLAGEAEALIKTLLGCLQCPSTLKKAPNFLNS